MSLKEDVLRLKKEKNAIILAHYYKLPSSFQAQIIGDAKPGHLKLFNQLLSIRFDDRQCHFSFYRKEIFYDF